MTDKLDKLLVQCWPAITFTFTDVEQLKVKVSFDDDSVVYMKWSPSQKEWTQQIEKTESCNIQDSIVF
jgi:hypothetical protein